MSLVVDTSVAVKWFVEEPDRPAARQVLKTPERLIAPDLLLAEVANVLWRRQRIGDVTPAQTDEAVSGLASFFDELAPSSSLIPAALVLARELEHSVYDCMFLALACRHEDTRLVTADSRFIAKVEKTSHHGRLLSLADFSPDPE